MPNRMMTATFDLLTENGKERLRDLLLNPRVVIEKRGLSYYYKPETDWSESEERVDFKIKYSLYDYDIEPTNYMKTFNFIMAFNIDSSTYRAYEEFLENKDNEIIAQEEMVVDESVYSYIEYLDHNIQDNADMLRAVRESPYFKNKFEFDTTAMQFKIPSEEE